MHQGDITVTVDFLAYEKEHEEIQRAAAYSVGYDFLSDPKEDIYTEAMGTKVDFK